MEHWGDNGQYPLPTFSTFTLTNSFGAKVCLCVCMCVCVCARVRVRACLCLFVWIHTSYCMHKILEYTLFDFII